MSTDAVLVVVGAAILLLGLPSTLIKRLWLSVPLLALATGVLLGPGVFGVLRFDELPAHQKVLEELARISISVSLVGTGLQFTAPTCGPTEHGPASCSPPRWSACGS